MVDIGHATTNERDASAVKPRRGQELFTGRVHSYRWIHVSFRQHRAMQQVLSSMCVLFFLSGCLGLPSLGCGEGYEEMHAGDYSIDSITLDATTNQLSVVVKNEQGASGFIREVESLEQDQTIWITLYIQHDGQTTSIRGEDTGHSWNVSGDSSNGDSWLSTVTFTSPDGFCDSGCEEIRFSAGYQDGVFYHDGTCDSSPWFTV